MSDELHLLGELLLNADSCFESRFDIKPAYFSNPYHSKIFGHMTALRESSGNIYHENLKSLLNDDSPQLLEYYEKNLVCPDESIGFDFYAERVINRFRFNNLITFAKKWAVRKCDQENIDELYQEFYGDINSLEEEEFENDLVTPKEMNLSTMDEIMANRDSDKPNFFSTGWDEMDGILGGLFRQDFITIGARTGVGKTILGLQLATAVLRAGGAAALFSIEMSFKEYNHRFIASESSINPMVLRDPDLLNDDHIDRLVKFCEDSSKWRYRINRKQKMNIDQIRRYATKAKRQLDGLDLVVIDHLHIVEPTKKGMEYRHHMKQVTLECKRIAQDLDCNVIALAQCNRTSENEKRPPRKSDLKESGSIEEDSNIIILIHRDEDSPTADILFEKNRHGPSPKKMKMNFIGEYVRFEPTN